VERERLVGGERVEAKGSGAVTDQRSFSDHPSRRGDLCVGDAQQHGVGTGPIRPAAVGANHLIPGQTESAGESGSQAATPDHGGPRTGRAIRGGIPFQFPHVRYRSAG
jgi:hypothetical protein